MTSTSTQKSHTVFTEGWIFVLSVSKVVQLSVGSLKIGHY